MSDLADRVAAQLGLEEGWREYLYDDDSSKEITKGSTVVGFPSIGFGFRCDRGGEPMPLEVGLLWRRIIIEKRIAALSARWPAFTKQPGDVQAGLIEMAYQMGVDGVLGFGLMLAALEHGDRETASVNVVASKFGAQTPARAERVAALIRGQEGEPA